MVAARQSRTELTSKPTRYDQMSNSSVVAKGARFLRWLPGLKTLRRYDPSWLKLDVIAGLVMTAMLVPVGIAYAQASGLPGITGLYATIVPLLAYAVFGPSPILILPASRIRSISF